MSLEFQNVDVRFTQGLDTRTQDKLVIPGKWKQLQNCSLADDDTPQRRDGCTALVAAATGNGLATYGDELLVVNGGDIKSVSTGGTDQTKTVDGKLGYVGVSKREVNRSVGNQSANDMATGGGYTCYVWLDYSLSTGVSSGISCSLMDETTGTMLLANEPVRATGTSLFNPRVVYCAAATGQAAAFFIFYTDAGLLYCRTIRVTSPTVLDAEVTLINNAFLLGGNAIDACCFGSVDGIVFDTTAAVVYSWNDGVTSVRTIQVTQTAGVPSILAGPTNLFTAASAATLSLCGFSILRVSATLCAIFEFSSGAGAMNGTAGTTINGSWAVVTAPTLFYADGPAIVGQCHITSVINEVGLIQIFTDRVSRLGTPTLTTEILKSFEVNSVLTIISGPNNVALSASFATTGANTQPRGPTGPWIAGKAFASSTNTFLPVWMQSNYSAASEATRNARTSNTQNVVFLLDVTGAHAPGFGYAPVVAKALYGGLGVTGNGGIGSAVLVSTPCSTPAIGDGFGYSCTERTLVSFVSGANFSPSGVVRLTFTPNTRSPTQTQLGESLYFAGGSTSNYDGLAVLEHGFPLFPEGVAVELVAGGGAMTAGAHQVVVVAEWVDNTGQRHQSAPSPAVQITTAANDRLRVRVPSLLVSQKTSVMFVPYITQGAALVFQRAVGPTSGGYGTANDTTAASTTLALIDLADTAYAPNEILYTQPNSAGTTLPNIAPGPSNVLAVHQNRLVMDVADQPGQFVVSQRYSNNLGLQFSPDLSGFVDRNAGDIVGFETMDEKLIIFCEKKPFVVYGAGPDDAGGSRYDDPQEIPSDVGCSDPRSILKMPHGIIFKSEKGWYMLGRDLVARYIGDGVDEFDANPVSSAVLLADRHECRFSSTSGTQLIYAYDLNGGQWSTTVYRADSGAAVTNVAVADAAYWPTGGYYVTVSTTHGLNRDTPGVFLDQPGTSPSALAIPTTARTAWLRMSTINGFQRVRRLYLTGTSPNAPTSTLSVAVDFDDAYGQVAPGSYTFSVVYGTMFPTFTVGNPVDFRHHMAHQKCKSVAFTFTDTPTVANPAGVNFQALSLELGMKRGLRKLPGAQSV